MPKTYPKNALEQAKGVLDAWGQINPAMTLGELTQAVFSKDITVVNEIEAQITNLENQLTNMRNQRQTYTITLWDKVKRVRAGVKAIYGDDSSAYEMVGGTRLSERKPPTRTGTA